MKIKKLLPGGLLNKSIRMVVGAGQRAGQKKLGEVSRVNAELIKSSKEIAQQTTKGLDDKLSPEVIKDLARTMARAEKSSKYSGILQKVQKDPRFTESTKEDVGEGLSKLREYQKKLFNQTQAIIDKDLAKPTMQRSGGFIDMTKDKKYWKGVI